MKPFQMYMLVCVLAILFFLIYKCYIYNIYIAFFRITVLQTVTKRSTILRNVGTLSSCAVFYLHNSPYRFHNSAGTTACPDRGSSRESLDSTPSTDLPCICRSEQLGKLKQKKESKSTQQSTFQHIGCVTESS